MVVALRLFVTFVLLLLVWSAGSNAYTYFVYGGLAGSPFSVVLTLGMYAVWFFFCLAGIYFTWTTWKLR